MEKGSRSAESLDQKLPLRLGYVEPTDARRAAELGARQAPREVQLAGRIPQTRFEPGLPYPNSRAALYYDARLDELYVAVPGYQAVYIINPRVLNSPARVAFRAEAPSEPCAVCLSRPTETLVIASFADRSKRTQTSIAYTLNTVLYGWKRSQQEVTVSQGNYSAIGGTLCALDGSSVLFGPLPSQRLFLLRVTEEHRLELLREIASGRHYQSVSATVTSSDRRTLVALALMLPFEVTVNLLAAGGLELLSRLPLGNFIDHYVLWAGEHLLLAESTADFVHQRIVRVDTTRMACVELVPEAAGVLLNAWCADGEHVVLWDINSKDIIVYFMR